jgi:hypothetical protein
VAGGGYSASERIWAITCCRSSRLHAGDALEIAEIDRHTVCLLGDERCVGGILDAAFDPFLSRLEEGGEALRIAAVAIVRGALGVDCLVLGPRRPLMRPRMPAKTVRGRAASAIWNTA